jgi:hypothetical protein
MGRNKPQRPRPVVTTDSKHTDTKPQGEQQLSNAVWVQIVKAIRALQREPSNVAA